MSERECECVCLCVGVRVRVCLRDKKTICQSKISFCSEVQLLLYVCVRDCACV